MTPEEKESLINEITERMLLRIPEIVGNLIENYATKVRVSKEFYEKYKEFSNHRDLVASMIESHENANPSKPFPKVIEDTIPEIRRHLSTVKKLDMKTVNKPELKFGQGEL